MNLLFHIILLLSFCKKVLTYVLNSDEIEISFQLIKRLEIRNCILARNLEDENLISDVKEFASAKIPTTCFNYDQLLNIVNVTKEVYFRTGLIFKEKNLGLLRKISNRFEKVSLH